MSYLINNQQKLNDIIFANRNKEYGAYEIRSSYGYTILKSLVFMITGFSAMITAAYFLTRSDKSTLAETVPAFIHDTVYVIPFRGEEPQPPEGKKADSPPATTTEESSEVSKPLVVDSSAVVETSTLTTAAISSTAVSAATPGLVSHNSGVGGKGNDSAATIKIGPDVKGMYEVDSEPQFAGGLKALYRFVSLNVRYPSRASDSGAEGTVHVRFVVDEKGKVGSLTLLNNKGYGLDEEALRVVGMIPDFIAPAMAKGHPVKVYYQLPIKFRLK